MEPPPLNENIQIIMTHNIRHAITTLNIYAQKREGNEHPPPSPECKHSKHYDTQHTSCNHHSEYLRSKEGRKWSPPPLNENIQSIMTHNIRHAITTLNIYAQKREGNEPPPLT